MATMLGNAFSPTKELVPSIDSVQPRELTVVRGPAFRVIAESLRLAAASPRPSRLAGLFGAHPLQQDAYGWYLSAIGELEAAHVLNDLGSEWVLLHPLRNRESPGSVDYLLVGSPGVFTVSIKDHTDQRVRIDADELTVNGRRTHHLRDAKLDAAKLMRDLGVDTVSSIVIIINPRSLERAVATLKEPSLIEPIVVGSSHLAALLTELGKSHANRLDRASIHNSVQTAERRGAWRSAAAVQDQTLVQEDGIKRLRLEVERASRRRVIWLVVAAVATAAAIAMLVLL